MDYYPGNGQVDVGGAGMPKRSLNTFLGRVLDEHGATAAEYAIMVAFIGAVIVATVTILGARVAGLFETIAGTF